MKNNITELVFILDRSGSMAGMEKDTIGGFNAMLKKQKACEGEAFVTTVLFSSTQTTLHDRLPVDRVPEITEREFSVGGCTALLDTLGDTIRHIEKIHAYIRPEDVPEHVVFAITTDGMENASRNYTSEQIKRMIRAKEEKGWEFLYLAANIDAVETGETFGIRRENAVNYRQDSRGSAVAYDAVCKATIAVRKTGKAGKAWRETADADFEERKDG